MLNLNRYISIAAMIVLSSFAALAAVFDDVQPEVTARVSRISFLRGDVRVRRSGAEEWEEATLNLPIVEGDEVSTGPDGRVELQFGRHAHLRADRDAYIQIKQLSDEGIAVSVSAGSAVARLLKLDSEKGYFEIDAPGTTVAIQKAGSYRVDAGDPGSSEVRVTVREGGEARVYSADSGFPLRSGRSATVITDGDNAGEWDPGDASALADEFDSWSAERDDLIERRLDTARNENYYDQDIYAAEELNDNGSWEFTSDYGYVWRPHASAIGSYRDWSPYRYGHWRWVPPFGWTWINDEPWGWATYHHGRWVWYRGRWVWTPYAYYRSNRIWWYPALVVIRVVDRSVCWYPLGYRQRYYGYNRGGYHDWVGNRDRDRDRRPRGNDGPSGNPQPPANGPIYGKPLPSPKPGFDPTVKPPLAGKVPTRPESKGVEPELPTTGVITVPYDEFGSKRKIGSPASPEVVKAVLRRVNDGGSVPELPDPRRGMRPQDREITARPPQVVSKAVPANRTGAGERRPDQPLDGELIKSRIFGNRPPVAGPEVRPGGQDMRRRTGAVERPAPPAQRPADVPPPDTQPRRTPLPRVEQPRPRDERPADNPPPRVVVPRPRDETPKFEPPVRRDPPQKREDPPPAKVEPPRRREEAPPPRVDPPKREQPRNDPPPKRETPPPRSETPRLEPPKRPAPSGRKVSPVN